MTKWNFKRIAALLLSATLVVGSGVTAFAADGESEGTGSYEGGPMQYPTLSVTLPTIPSGTYNYIEDPNGLIAMTSAAHYADSEFTGTTGIFFLTTPKTSDEGSKNQYTANSKALTLVNENAQDIDVTIKLEQKTAGSESIAYSSTGTFETTDKDKKIYLAVTDGKQTDPTTVALTADKAATITTKVVGNKDNYEAAWTSDDGYLYKLKTPAEGQTLSWFRVDYNLTGALNTNAEWEDGLTFPALKVTWSYAEHQDNAAPSIATTTYNLAASTDIEVTTNFGTGTSAATSITGVKKPDGGLLGTANYTISGNKITFLGEWVDKILVGMNSGDSKKYKVVFNTEDEVELTFTKP
jgi:hypothetical protein